MSDMEVPIEKTATGGSGAGSNPTQDIVEAEKVAQAASLSSHSPSDTRADTDLSRIRNSSGSWIGNYSHG